MLFHAKMGILGKYLYVSDTLFILYLEGNYTLFGDKLYFIWKFSSGNTVMDTQHSTLRIHTPLSGFPHSNTSSVEC